MKNDKPEKKDKKKKGKKKNAEQETAPLTTKGRRKSDDKKADAPASSSMEKAMQRIGGKWKLPVLWAMRDGEEIRYSEIKRRVNGITDVMLSQTLKELAEAGLVQRKQYGDVPPRVAYRTTTLAADLFPALQRIAAWGDQL